MISVYFLKFKLLPIIEATQHVVVKFWMINIFFSVSNLKMDQNFFKKVRVLDGGMGQELLSRGMEPNGTLWSANALLKKNTTNFY